MNTQDNSNPSSAGSHPRKKGEIQETAELAPRPWAKLLYDPPRASNVSCAMEDYLPAEDVVSSYAYQWYRLSYEGKEYAIRPAKLSDNPYNALWPEGGGIPAELEFLKRSYIIGYCHPHGIPSSSEQRPKLRAQAEELIRSAGYQPLDIVALNRDSKWLEPMLLVQGISAEEARRIGAALHQPVVVALRSGRHHVDQVNGLSRYGGYEIRVSELPESSCPMSLGYEIEQAPTREGGPWVSRSMSVAGQWQIHYADSHTLLPCQPCGQRQAEQGRAIMLAPWATASRYKYIHAVDYQYLDDGEILRRFEEGTLTPLHGVGGGC